MGLHEVGGSGLTRPQPRSRMRALSLTLWGDCYAAAFGVSAGSEFKFLDFFTRHKALQDNTFCLEYCDASTLDFYLMLVH
jgi:hypothetical protein